MKHIEGTAVFRKCNNFPEWSIECIKVDDLTIESKKVAKRYIEYQIEKMGHNVKLIDLKYKTKSVTVIISNEDYKIYMKRDSRNIKR